MNNESEKENAYYRGIAQFEEIERVWLSLDGYSPDQFQAKYLKKWKLFLAERPHYLYPDHLLLPDDIFSWEYEPHSEAVTAQSYPNVERLLVEARIGYADNLAHHYEQMRQEGELRRVLAERLLNLAVRLVKCTILQELSGNRHKVQLPDSSVEASETPKEFGSTLALLAHFLEVRQDFLAVERCTVEEDQKTVDLPAPDVELATPLPQLGLQIFDRLEISQPISDPRDHKELEIFRLNFTASLCDRLAEVAGLPPQNKPWKKTPGATQLIWLLADILHGQGYLRVEKAEAAKLLALRYAVSIGKRHSKPQNSLSPSMATPGGIKYDNAKPGVYSELANMKQSGIIGMRLR